MRRSFIFFSIVFLLGLVYLISLNMETSIELKYIYSEILKTQTEVGLTDQGAYFTYNVGLPIYTIIVGLLGGFIGSGIVYMFLSAQKDKVKAYKRELEKTVISGTTSASKVEVLEAKIKTLEKAFNTVIDERKKLEIQIENLNTEIENMNKNNN